METNKIIHYFSIIIHLLFIIFEINISNTLDKQTTKHLTLQQLETLDVKKAKNKWFSK